MSNNNAKPIKILALGMVAIAILGVLVSMIPIARGELGPDLETYEDSDLWFDPDPGTEGKTTTIYVKVRNIGVGDAGFFRVGWKLSGETNWRAKEDVNGLRARSEVIVAFTWNPTKGNYTVLAMADVDNQVSEENEGNNQRTESYNVKGKPDLIPGTPIFRDSDGNTITEGYEGQTITVISRISNQGEGDAESFTVQLLVDDSVEDSNTNVSVPGNGGETDVSLTWTTTTKGTYIIKIKVDTGNEINELNETNNEKQKNITIVEKADLTLTQNDITFSDNNPTEGNNIYIYVKLYNNGKYKARNFEVLLLVDNSPIEVKTINSLSGGANTTTSFYWNAQPNGTRQIKIQLDSNEEIDESNEGNNEAEKPITVLTKPELTLTSDDIEFSNDAPTEDETITISATIHNYGDTNAEKFTVDFLVDNNLKSQKTITVLAHSDTVVNFTWKAIAENHTVKIKVDSNNKIDEGNENNNQATKDIRVMEKPKLSISASDITFSNNNPTEGETITIYARIYNKGDKRANNFNVSFYVDNIVRNTQTISLNGDSNVQLNWVWNAERGTKNIKVVVDVDDVIEEKNENDNEATKSINVKTKPDIALSSADISFSDNNPTEGKIITITATIHNYGEADANNFKVDLEIDGVWKARNTLSVSGNNKNNTQFSWDTTNAEGVHIIKIISDSINDIDNEQSENNNNATRNISVKSKADLTLTSNDITFSKTEIIDGDSIIIYAKIYNNGETDANNFKVTFYDGTTQKSELTTSLYANQNDTIQFTWSATPDGNHDIKIKLDRDNLISEKREGNNEAIKQINVKKKADLIISTSDIVFSKDEPSEGQIITINVTVRNNGQANITQSFEVKFYIDNNEKDTKAISSLPGNSQTLVQFSWKSEVGNHTVKIVLDPNDVISESNNSNNEARRNIRVKSKPDLSVSSSNLTFSDNTPIEGKNITIYIRIYNNGEGDADNFRVGLYIDNNLEYTLTISISGNKDTVVQWNWIAIRGNHQVKVRVDIDSIIPERDEGNNEAYKEINVSTKADLVIYSGGISFSKTEPVDGDSITIYVTIHNEGDQSANNFKVIFYLDGVQDEQQTISIGPNSERETQFGWDARYGIHEIKIVADDGDKIDESNETNNEVIKNMYVKRKADLTLTSGDITFSNNNPTDGDTITIYAKIYNNGETDATNFKVQLLIDGVVYATNNIDIVNANNSYITSFSWNTIEGDKNVRIKLDTENKINEQNEGNNEASVNIYVKSKADLTLTKYDITFSDDTPFDGDNITVYVNVNNFGDTDATPNFVVALYVDNELRAQKTINITAQNSKVVSFAWNNVKAGDRNVKIIVDATNRIKESNETNNQAETILHVWSEADLTLSSNDITFSKSSLTEGDNITIYTIITNNGDYDANNFKVQFLVDDIFKEEKTISVNALSSRQTTFSWNNIPKGDHDIRIKLDTDNVINEHNETNNEAVKTVHVNTLPDLKITQFDIVFSDDDPAEGGNITIWATVNNMGEADATNVKVLLKIDDVDIRTNVINVKGNNRTITSFNWRTEAGNHTIKIIVDNDNEIKESNKSNNNAQKTIFVDSPLDLYTSTFDIYFSKNDPFEGETITITTTIRSEGERDANNFRVAWYVVSNDEKLIAQTTTSLPKNTNKNLSTTFNTSGYSGDIIIKVFVDAEDKIVESNETNNIAQRTLNVKTKADLIITTKDITLSKEAVDGVELTISAKIRNNGDYDANNFKVQLLIDNVVIQNATLSISKRSYTTLNFVYTFSSGERSIKVKVDVDNIIDERNETNNEAEKNINVLTKPDIIITNGDITFSNNDPSEDTNITISVFVQNLGEANATNFRVALYIDNNPERTVSISLPGGGNTTINFTWKTISGIHIIKIKGDDDERINEQNENNNIGSKNISVRGRADLTFPTLTSSDITLSKTPVEGESLTISAIIKNTGATDANNFKVQLLIDEGSPQTKSISIGANTQYQVSFSWNNPSSGDHTLKIKIDTDDIIDEVNEGNNEVMRTVHVNTKPDLLLSTTDIIFSDNNPYEEGSIIIYATIYNNGEAIASGFKATLYVDGEPQTNIFNITIDGKTQKTIQFTWDITSSGSHTIEVRVDEGDSIKESDENNNKASRSISVRSKPELTISSSDITLSKTEVTDGEIITIYAKIYNNGETKAENFTIVIEVNSIQIYSIQITLNGNSNTQISTDWTASSGNKVIKVKIDTTNVIPEGNEGNNEATKNINVKTKADLTIGSTDISFDDSRPQEGQNIIISVNINNNGGSNATNFKAVLYIDNQPAVSKADITVNANSQRIITFNWNNVELGAHTIRIEVDTENQVNESNENNNIASKNITVYSKADLIITTNDITFSNNTPTEGETITIYATIKNNGGTEANDFKVALYVDNVKKSENTNIDVNYNSEYTTSFLWNAVPGNKIIRIVIDTSGTQIQEDNTTNNQAEKIIYVYSKADLIITTNDIMFSNNNPSIDEVITITAMVNNTGETNANNFKVEFYVDNTLESFKQMSVNSLSANTITFSWKAIVGNKIIKIKIDTLNSIPETSETNNEAQRTITVKRKADLSINKDDIIFDKTTLTDGEILTITVIVKNSGETDANNFNISFYVDDILKSYQVKSLSAKTQSGDSQITLQFTWTAIAGNHILKFIADAERIIPDDDLGNNVAQKSLTVKTNADLEITNSDISLSSDEIYDGDDITINIIIRNKGETPANNFNVELNIGNYISTKMVSVNANSPQTITFTWKAVKGAHDIKIKVDSTDIIKEITKTNNNAQKSITVKTKPDLSIYSTDIIFSNNRPIDGETISINATIRNIGDEKAENFNVILYIDGIQHDSILIAILDGKSFTSVEFNWDAILGNHIMNISVDINDVIEENKEDNNFAKKSITVKTKPDLIIDDILFGKTAYTEGDIVDITVKLINNGETKAENFKVKLVAIRDGNETTIGEETIASIGTNQTVEKTFQWKAKEGKITIKAIIDDENKINEQNKDNNKKTKGLNVSKREEVKEVAINPISIVIGAILGLVIGGISVYTILKPKKPKAQKPLKEKILPPVPREEKK